MKRIAFLLIAASLFACGNDSQGNDNSKDSFERKLLLENWVQNIIIPDYDKFQASILNLKTLYNRFETNTDAANLKAMQDQFAAVQRQWQRVSIYEFGKAEELNYRAQMNTYPIDLSSEKTNGNTHADVSTVTDNLKAKLGDKDLAIDKINFDLVVRADEQGLPTVDYLLNGVADTQDDITAFYATHDNASNHKLYLKTLIDRMVSLTTQITDYWKTNAQDIIANSGSSATASVDKLINDYIQYIEQGFRENKIAAPSGKRNGTEDKTKIESRYSPKQSKLLLEDALAAIKGFYYGTPVKESVKTAVGIDDYLNFLNATAFDRTTAKEVKLSARMDELFADIDTAIKALDQDLGQQIETDNQKMLSTFNSIQKLVVLLKTNVTSSINVKIDYVDGDGD